MSFVMPRIDSTLNYNSLPRHSAVFKKFSCNELHGWELERVLEWTRLVHRPLASKYVTGQTHSPQTNYSLSFESSCHLCQETCNKWKITHNYLFLTNKTTKLYSTTISIRDYHKYVWLRHRNVILQTLWLSLTPTNNSQWNETIKTDVLPVQ